MTLKNILRTWLVATSVLVIAACQTSQSPIDTDLTSLKTAVERNPSSGQSHNNLGAGLASYNRDKEAFRSFSEAIAISPNNAQPYYNRGLISLKRKRYNEALSDFNQATALRPTYSIAYVAKGNALRLSGNKNGAISAYQNAIKHDRFNPRAYFQIGLIQQKQNNHQGAIASLTKAMSFGSSVPQLFYARGNSYIARNELESAKNDFMTASRLMPKSYDAYIRLARVSAKLNDLEEACTAYTNARIRIPNSKEANVGRRKTCIAKPTVLNAG